MLIDTSQDGNILTVSYSDESGEIKLHKFDIQATNGYGCYDYEICDEEDPEKHPTLRHYRDNLPIKRVPARKFDFDEKREFLLKQIPSDLSASIFSMHAPNMYMCDIEIDTGDGDVFPDPNKADFVIDSIQICSPDLKVLTLTRHKKAKQDPLQIKLVQDMINNHYSDIQLVQDYTKVIEYQQIVFDTEKELVQFFYKLINEKLHSIAFWNGNRFDVPYLWNRCPKIGVDIAAGSPTGEISHFNYWPKHRYVFDYMEIVAKWGWDIPDLSSTALDHISSQVVGTGKFKYDGNYPALYAGPIENFLTYGAIDVIAMQLIHLKRGYTKSKNALVYYCKGSIYDAGQVTALVHSVIWDELYAENKINALPYVKEAKKPYPGGYVKTPARKFAMFPVCEDFSALYPRLMQSYNFSFENLIGKIKSEEERKKLTEEGYVVSVNGNIYKNDKDYTLRKVETKLLGERYAYKDLQQEVFLNILPDIEKEFKKRGLEIPKTK
jgi:DNA polymerase elongation subunit (family B)